jgi:hypothetical protein
LIGVFGVVALLINECEGFFVEGRKLACVVVNESTPFSRI